MAFLIENYAGNFPVWLAPVQAVVIPIADRHVEYAEQVAEKLRAAGLRVEVDARSERMNAKVRDAQLQKIPYMLVVGDKEADRQRRLTAAAHEREHRLRAGGGVHCRGGAARPRAQPGVVAGVGGCITAWAR